MYTKNSNSSEMFLSFSLLLKYELIISIIISPLLGITWYGIVWYYVFPNKTGAVKSKKYTVFSERKE